MQLASLTMSVRVETRKCNMALLWQDVGVCAAVGEQDHLGQFVEKLNGASSQLCETPDGCSMYILKDLTKSVYTF